MTTRILLAPIKVSIGLVKLELRIVRSVARLAFELGRESARGESHDNGAAAEAAPEAASPAAVAEEPTAPRAARTTRSASRPRGAAASRAAATPRKPAARKPAGTRRPAARRPPAAAPEPAAPPPAPAAGEPAAPHAPEPPRHTSDPTPGEIAAAREALREAEIEDPIASVGPAAHAGPEIHLDPPWEGYDAMALDEVLGRLQAADPTTLAAVRLYESTHESRQAILLATETP